MNVTNSPSTSLRHNSFSAHPDALFLPDASPAAAAFRNQLQRLRHDRIQCLRPQTASNYQQPQFSAARGISFFRRLQLSQFRYEPDSRKTAPSYLFLTALGKPSNTLSASFANILLARPGIEFCSCISSGLSSNEAISPPGNAG